MKLGAVLRSDIYLTVEQSPAKHQSDEGCVTSHRFKCSPLSPNNIGCTARENEGKKERIEGVDLLPQNID